MSKLLFFYENIFLGGATDNLVVILKKIPAQNYLLIYGGTNETIRYIENKLPSSSIRKFRSYAPSQIPYPLTKRNKFFGFGFRLIIKIFSPILIFISNRRFKKFLSKIDFRNFSKLIINSGGFYGTETSRLFIKINKETIHIPCLYFCHNHILDEFMKSKKKFDLIDSNISTWCVGSKFIEKQLINCGVSKKRIQMFRYGIDLQVPPESFNKLKTRVRLNLPSNSFIITQPSSFELRKGHEHTLNAFKKIRKYINNSKLLFVGSGGNYEHTIKNMTKQLGLENHVIFLEHHEPLEEIYVASDMICLPSQFHETTPLAILIALACGLPVLTTKREDFEDILVDYHNALLVPINNHEQIAEKILALFNDNQLYKKLSNNGKIVYKEFYSEKQMTNQINSILNS